MPTTPTDSAELGALLQLTESAPYELLLSLGAVYWAPPRHQAWVERARAALGPATLADVRFFAESLWHRLALMELPVDYPGPPGDAAGFIDYVAALDADTFLFYLWGRIIPRDDVPALRAAPERIAERFYAFYEATWPGSGPSHTRGEALLQVATAPAATQARLVALLRTYYDQVFAAELPELRRRWAASLEEKRQALARQDPASFLARLLENRSLPPMFPEGTPLREIRVIPSYYIWRANFEIWGYGTLSILYNASQTESRLQERDQAGTQLAAVAAALADPNRLKILAAIAQDPGCYGHKLARLCGISQPAVSRHMGILKRAGLVDEEPSDGRVLYRLRQASLEAFLPQLLQYLND
ncbi:MAG TPA: metalloregulator ArsR/SmtB family transcription factor [Chloroflexia bacterium]|nr:metalloregulator ArsR/SmtB family transcription factor [Chloroflexia bacterium]